MRRLFALWLAVTPGITLALASSGEGDETQGISKAEANSATKTGRSYRADFNKHTESA
jgi:hypothetical protein